MIAPIAAVEIDEQRQRTIEATPPGISRELLEAFPELVAHPGPAMAAEHVGTYYQDRQLGGAICATAQEAELLYWAAYWCQPVVALEIGSYVGWTAAHIAKAMETSGQLICIDNLSECENGGRQLVRLNCNLQRAGVVERCHIIPGRSPEALDFAVGAVVDFAFVDGYHRGEQPVLDVQGVAAIMASNGVIAVHDTWMPDVQRACDWLRDQGWTELVFETPGRLAFYYGEERPDWWETFVERAHV